MFNIYSIFDFKTPEKCMFVFKSCYKRIFYIFLYCNVIIVQHSEYRKLYYVYKSTNITNKNYYNVRPSNFLLAFEVSLAGFLVPLGVAP